MASICGYHTLTSTPLIVKQDDQQYAYTQIQDLQAREDEKAVSHPERSIVIQYFQNSRLTYLL